MNTTVPVLDVRPVPGGYCVKATFPHPHLLRWIEEVAGKLPLIIADPPYGNIVDDAWDKVGEDDVKFCLWMLSWTRSCAGLSLPGAALYVWGGVGKYKFRPFYRYLVDVERETTYQLSTHITWAKKRAYGIQWGYLFCREEIAYLILGDPKKPRRFNIPLLDKKRGYAGYDPEHPAKSEYLRRTNVWMDITEILRGKTHTAQKTPRLHEIMIETHTEVGEWVLDPFAGSGTTGFAARKLGRKFILVENDPVEFEKMVESLKSGV